MLSVAVNNGDAFRITHDGENWFLNDELFEMDLAVLGDDRFHIIREGRSLEVEVLEKDFQTKQFRFRINGQEYSTRTEDKLDRLFSQMGMNKGQLSKINQVKAPMPGLIQSIAVQPGDFVHKGDTLLVLVAMKMENSIKAPVDGKVQSVKVNNGQSVEKNHILIEFD